MTVADVRFRCPNCGWAVLVTANDADPVALKETRCAGSCGETITYEYVRC